MPKIRLGYDVFTAAYERIREVMSAGHRCVIAFSGGKDSTVMLELAIMVARELGTLPLDVVIQEEEVSYPGLYEFVERTAQRPEVRMSWLVMQQPMLNIFNRADPFWWVMDPLLDPNDWVRKPPSYAQFTDDKPIELMVNAERFPVTGDMRLLPDVPAAERPQRMADCLAYIKSTNVKESYWSDVRNGATRLVNFVGMRTSESAKRLLGLHSSGGFVAGPNSVGAYMCRPIYDWSDADVWRFISENKLDYCTAYNTFLKMGAKPRSLRIGPPTMTTHGMKQMQMAARAWPQWFDRVCKRVQGVRVAVQFGAGPGICKPRRLYGETWEDCFKRECLGPETPSWIKIRAQQVHDMKLSMHAHHSKEPFPEVHQCTICGVVNTWEGLTNTMWNGDPYCLKTANYLEMMEPSDFRNYAPSPNGTPSPAGTWAGNWATLLGKKSIKVIF